MASVSDGWLGHSGSDPIGEDGVGKRIKFRKNKFFLFFAHIKIVGFAIFQNKSFRQKRSGLLISDVTLFELHKSFRSSEVVEERHNFPEQNVTASGCLTVFSNSRRHLAVCEKIF